MVTLVTFLVRSVDQQGGDTQRITAVGRGRMLTKPPAVPNKIEGGRETLQGGHQHVGVWRVGIEPLPLRLATHKTGGRQETNEKRASSDYKVGSRGVDIDDIWPDQVAGSDEIG